MYTWFGIGAVRYIAGKNELHSKEIICTKVTYVQQYYTTAAVYSSTYTTIPNCLSDPT